MIYTLRRTILIAAVILCACSGQSRASDANDCKGSKNPELKAEACTRYLKRPHPGDVASAYNERGIAYAMQEKFDLALADFNRSIELDPKSPNGYYNRALVYGRTEKYEKSIADCTKTLELDPDHPEVHSIRAVGYEKLNKKDLAIADYLIAIEKDPNDPDTKAGLRRLGVKK